MVDEVLSVEVGVGVVELVEVGESEEVEVGEEVVTCWLVVDVC